jgi:hypothetical protein
MHRFWLRLALLAALTATAIAASTAAPAGAAALEAQAAQCWSGGPTAFDVN